MGYKCKACERRFATQASAEQHFNDMNDDAHQRPWYRNFFNLMDCETDSDSD